MIFLPFTLTKENIFTEDSHPELLKIVHSCDQPGWKLNAHSHTRQAEILYIAGGEGIYTADNMPYHVHEGDIVIFNSDVIHSVESDVAAPLDVWSVTIQNFQLQGLPPNHLLPDRACPVLSSGSRRAVFASLYEEICWQRQREQAEYAQICHMLSVSLLLLCYQLSKEPQNPAAPQTLKLASRVRSYLDEHFREPITMETLAAHFHVSASHISHEVNSAFHVSPINYLIDRRIRHAQWELASTDHSLKDVAIHAGYENPSHFSQLFFRRTGLKPLEFRRTYTEQNKNLRS